MEVTGMHKKRRSHGGTSPEPGPGPEPDSGGALAAGLTGAIAGSEVPILGNAVGFLVGIGIYYIVDSTVGEDVEAGVRSALGEGGCPRPQPARVDRDDYMWGVRGGCFAAETPVLMADGTTRAIAGLSEGDEVLAYDPDEKALRRERVVSLHSAGPKPYLELSCAQGGAPLKVTAEHPIYSEGEWVAAGELKAGSRILRASPATGGVETVEVERVRHSEADAPVYNLTVGGCHTFFARDILVHNKNI